MHASVHFIGVLAACGAFCFVHAAHAQGFAPGLTMFPAPAGFQSPSSQGFVQLAKDGAALGATYSGVAVAMKPSGTFIMPGPSRVDDISNAGTYTVQYGVRRDINGVSQTLLSGLTGEPRSTRTQISGDGSVVAGSRETTFSLPDNAFRWTALGGGQYLGPHRPGAAVTAVMDLSTDGSTIVGGGDASSGRAWKWTEPAGYALLPLSPIGGTGGAIARATNNDGTIIVGDERNAFGGRHPVVWRDNSVVILPTPAGYATCIPFDVSDDGSVIVASLRDSTGPGESTSAVWTASDGWMRLDQFMLQHGISIPSNYTVTSAQMDVSGDGLTFATSLYHPQTLTTVPAVFVIPSPGAIAPLGVALTGLLLNRRRRRS